MAKSKFNHKKRIEDLQPAKLKAIYPGTIIQFKYNGEKIFDKLPMVLVLWNDYKESKIHGINLNYLNETIIKKLMAEIVEENPIITEDQDSEDDYDDARLNADPDVDIVLVPLRVLKAIKKEYAVGTSNFKKSKFRVCRIEDRINKVLASDKFCR